MPDYASPDGSSAAVAPYTDARTQVDTPESAPTPPAPSSGPATPAAATPPAGAAATAAPAAAADLFSHYADSGAATGLPAGVPGLPVGSTGQDPAAAPAGPRASTTPMPGGPIPAYTPPSAPATGVKGFLAGLPGGTAKTGTDWNLGAAPVGSTDATRDLGNAAHQQQQQDDAQTAAAAKQAGTPTPTMPAVTPASGAAQP